jgi:hypothetical protein
MREHTMKKTIVGLFCLVLATRALANAAQKTWRFKEGDWSPGNLLLP